MASEEKQSILDLVTGFNIVTAVSQKSGKPYEVYEVEFEKDFRFRFFLERAEGQVVKMLQRNRDEKEAKFDLEKDD